MKTVETKKSYILHAEKINAKYEIGYSHRVSYSSEHLLRLTALKSEFYFQIVFFLNETVQNLKKFDLKWRQRLQDNNILNANLTKKRFVSIYKSCLKSASLKFIKNSI